MVVDGWFQSVREDMLPGTVPSFAEPTEGRPVGLGSPTLPLERLSELRRVSGDESPQSRACWFRGEIRVDLGGVAGNAPPVMFMAFVHS
jgi:hypothetical protein